MNETAVALLPNPEKPFPKRALSWLIALALFVGCMILYTRHNTFPFFYHTDEPLEIQLVLKQQVNFHHPLLMGNTTDLIMRLGGVSRSDQNVALVGRWCTAFFASVAVVAFAFLAMHYQGPIAGLCAGTLVALHPLLFQLAHYYKEDPALLMGLSLSFLAMARCWQNPSGLACALLGAANALAVSGKYVGIIAAFLALPVLLLAGAKGEPQHRVRRFAAWLVGFALLVSIVNYQLVTHIPVFIEGLSREVYFVGQGGNQGVSQSVPHDKYLGPFKENINVLMWVFIGFHFFSLWKRRAQRNLAEWITALFPIALALILTFTPKTAERYFLPVTSVTCYLAGLGIVESTRSLVKCRFLTPGLNPEAIAIICLAIVAGRETYVLSKTYYAFTRDTRKELVAWIATHVPADAVIAEDRKINLPHPGNPYAEAMGVILKQKVITSPYVADLGSLEELRDQGVSYVAINETSLFRKNKIPGEAIRDDYLRRKSFYDRIAKDADLVWQRSVRKVSVLHPAFKLYRLRAREGSADESGAGRR